MLNVSEDVLDEFYSNVSPLLKELLLAHLGLLLCDVLIKAFSDSSSSLKEVL